MKRTNKIALAGTLALALAGALACAQPAGGDDNAAPPEGPGPGRRPPLPKEILDQYDTNHDGTLDANERENLRKDVEAGKVQLPGPGRFGPPGGGMRRMDPEALHKMLLDRYDANKNGKLDDEEYIQIGKDVESGKLRLAPPMGARMGGRGMGMRGPGPGGPGMGGPGMGGPGMGGPGAPPPPGNFGGPPNPPGPPPGAPPGAPPSESPEE